METNKALENTIAKGVVKANLWLMLISIVASLFLGLLLARITTAEKPQ